MAPFQTDSCSCSLSDRDRRHIAWRPIPGLNLNRNPIAQGAVRRNDNRNLIDAREPWGLPRDLDNGRLAADGDRRCLVSPMENWRRKPRVPGGEWRS